MTETLILLQMALADVSPEVENEIVVYGHRESVRMMQKIHRHLKGIGYKTAVKKNGKIIFEPVNQWKPTLIFNEEGLVTYKRSKPRFEPWVAGRKENKWRYLSCIPPFTPMCIQMQSWLVDKRKFENAKSKVIASTQGPIKDWQTALKKEAHEKRISELLPKELSQIWIREDKEVSADIILGMWRDRNCSQEGNQAREAIGQFIHRVIQPSVNSISTERLRETEEKCPCQGCPSLDKTAMKE